MRRRRQLPLVVLTAAMLLQAACGTDVKKAKAPASPERPASVARVRLPSDNYGYPSPFTYLLGPGLVNVNLLFDTLLWKDSSGEPIPWLAKEWSRSPDGLEYRFTLHDNVKWSDGRPLTTDDVLFTFDYLTNGAGKTGSSGLFSAIPGMQVVAESPTVVVFKLPKPVAPFEVTVAGRTPILPRHVWESVTDPTKFRDPKALIGSGPYTLESYDNDSTYSFVANPSYFMGVPYVRRIEMVPAPDQLLALRRGEVDLAGIGFEQGVPEAALDPFNDPKFGKVEAAGETTTALHFNMTRGFPYDDKRFRQAVAYTIDRKDIVKRILLGRGAPGSLGGLAPTNAFAAKDLPAYDRDLVKAKALLDAIGLKDANGDGARDLPDGSAFRPELLTTPRWNPKSVEIVKEYLHDVGIEVTISSIDYPAFDAATSDARYDMALIAYGGLGGDPDSMRTRYSSRLKPRSFSRVHGYVNARFDDLADQQLAAVEKAQRISIVQEMQRIVAEDVPTIPLYLADRMQVFDTTVFDAWYYTPGGVFGGYPGPLNKHVFVTGKQVGF